MVELVPFFIGDNYFSSLNLPSPLKVLDLQLLWLFRPVVDTACERSVKSLVGYCTILQLSNEVALIGPT